MRIPQVNDEAWTNIVKVAASPVFTVWTVAGHGGSHKLEARCRIVAEEYDDRMIFLAVSVVENPSIAPVDVELPRVTVHRQGRLVWSSCRPSLEELRAGIERALERKGGIA